jgi:hypothetical protein
VRRIAKASTAGLTQRQASRLALLALSAVAFLAIPTAQASAELIVNLNGAGAGTVTSSPPGINCSNVGSGAPGPSCSASFGETGVELTASPGSGFVFSQWSGDDPIPGAFGPTCNEGSENPCATFDPAAFFGEGSTHITASFQCTPPIAAPQAITGEASAGADSSLRTLAGEVDPEGCGLKEGYFEYGPTTAYSQSTQTEPDMAAIGKGSAPVSVSAETEPLDPNTIYHYRLVAVGPGGTAKGEDRTFATGPLPLGACPNEARRLEQGIKALLLPPCMALEMVSPPHKDGYTAKSPNVSADGSRVSFVSGGALGEDPPGLPSVAATYVASRGASAWTSQMTVPHVDPRLHAQWDLTSEQHPSFTPDFSRWFGIGATAEQLQHGIARAYEAGLGGFFRPLSDPLIPFSFNFVHPHEVVRSTFFQGASTDHSHLYFQPGFGSFVATYFPGDPDLAGLERGANVYLARSGAGGQPTLELLQRDRTGKVWGGNCGARLGGIGPVDSSGSPAPNGIRNQGAVSPDGSRTYFSTRATQPQSGSCDEAANKLRILERLETPTGPQIAPLFASECSRPSLPNTPGPCSSADGDDLYQGASVDQSKVYFTTNRQLAGSDIDGSSAECSVLEAIPGCDLYLYDRSRPAGERLVQVSAGEDVPGKHEGGKEADVFNAITAISADGSHVYFVATGVLTEDANPEGKVAQEGEPNLYMWNAQSEETTFIGTLAPLLSLQDTGDAIVFSDEGNGLWGGQGTWHNNAYPVPVLSPSEQGGERGEEGGDGHVLLFESKAELGENDADGRHLDVYRYDANAETLACLSCAPASSASEPDEAPFDVDPRGDRTPLGTDFAESHRWVSEDGEGVGFMTPERLLPGDVDSAPDFYLWRQGSLARLPGKPFLVGTPGPYLSHDGSTVAFATATPLLPQDGDVSADIYVARAGGGYPNPPAPRICQPDNPSNDCQQAETPPQAPKTASEATGPGNPKPHPCAKGKVRRSGRCVAKHKRHAHKRHRTRQANTHRRAGK